MDAKEEIKSRADVVDIVGRYLQLKPAGGGNFKAICPFHSEKTPSFYVSREKQIWHCFGCDKGGDVIAFIMEIEGVDFITALRQLGDIVGVRVPELKVDKNKGEKEKLFAVNDLAARFYHKILMDHELGKTALEYAGKRKINNELLEKFLLGAAPDQWTVLTDFLLSKGIDRQIILKAGLAKPRRDGRGLVDRFRNRLMIPLRDAAGRVVGFTGRLLQEQTEKTGPKYLNSPETLIYHKSDILFGLYLAKTAIKSNDAVIITEGNIDVIASHRAGVENVVAGSGTALTESHLRQIKRFTNNIVFSFDSDNAGFAAFRRALHLAQSMDFNIKVLVFSEGLGKDPDDIVNKDPQLWRDLIKNAKPAMKYIIERESKKLDLSDVNSKKQFIRSIINDLRFIADPIEKEHWLQQISDMARIEEAVVKKMLSANSLATAVGNIQQTALKTKKGEKKISKNSKSKTDLAAEFLLGYCLNYGKTINIDLDLLPEKYKIIYKNCLLLYNQGDKSRSTQEIIKKLEERLENTEQIAILRRAVLTVEQFASVIGDKKVREELNRHIKILQNAFWVKKRKSLEAEIRLAEMSGDKEKLNKLLQEYKNMLSN
ncbi:DNA primase [Candidatus Parcubacteria bacterium]|nr:MAG: DNA primase [Candidatus Parcubacteria bacterium]